jgi:hypothetical protein
VTAERVAEAPVRGVLQRACACGGGGACTRCERGELARSAAGPEPESVPPAVHESLRTAGRPLDAQVRTEVEGRLGHDLSGVRIHADRPAAEAASAVHAHAFTVGSDVVFAAGRFQPGTPDGRRLLLHELTHTVQQRDGAGRASALRIGPAGTAAEAHADRVASGAPAPIEGAAAPAPVIRRQVDDREPSHPDLGGLNLEIREDGRVDVTVVAPTMPAVGSPALGLRRLPGRRTEFLVGGEGRAITPAELPELLRGALDDSSRQPPGTTRPLPLRIPTCEELRKLDGGVKPWVEHRLEAVLQGRQPLSRPFYEGIAAACPPAPAEEPSPRSAPAGPETMPVAPDEAIA